MSRGRESVRSAWRDRVRGALVLVTAATLALPLLLASGARTTSVEAVVAAARAQVGDAYLWGGNGPDAWDCSGFTSYVWREAGGVTGIPRTSGQQQRWAVPIPREQLLTGDLVFFGEPVSHVALYVGDGRVVDASSARKGVVERALWNGPVVRYGRVPRPGMPPVTPWTPPPAPAADPSAAPADEPAPAAGPGAVSEPGGTASAGSASPSGTGTTPPSPPAAVKPAAAKPAAPKPTAAKPAAAKPAAAKPAGPKPAAAKPAAPVVRALAGLPARQQHPSSAVALKAVAGARSVLGSRAFTDVRLVTEAWRHGGGPTLPRDRQRIADLGVQVARPDLRVGDLVVYGEPAGQVYLYVGSGYMVGHSPDHRAVVARRVHTGDVRFVRLPVPPARVS